MTPLSPKDRDHIEGNSGRSGGSSGYNSWGMHRGHDATTVDDTSPLLVLTENGNRSGRTGREDTVVSLGTGALWISRVDDRTACLPSDRLPAVLCSPALCSRILMQSWLDAGFLRFLHQTIGSAIFDEHSYSLSRPVSARASALVHDIAAETEARRPGYEAVAVSSFVALLALAYRSDDGVADRARMPGTIARLIDYVQSHYTEALTLEALADRCAMSPSHLSHRFRQATGKPLFTYINEIRIDRACALLKRSSLPVIEIAYAVGYNSLSFFNRYFRRVTGASPSEYRRRLQR